MRLYYSPASPFARKCLVTAEELGIADRLERVTVATSPLGTGETPIPGNPLGKLPTLEREEGPAIYDSTVIFRYLNETAGGALYPAGERIWATLTLESLADGIMDAALLMALEYRLRPEEMQFGPWVEGQWQKVSRALDALEALWMSHLHGPVDIGQIATGCALGYLDLRHGARDWRAGRPQLAHWFTGFDQRPGMAGTRP